jgi:RNA 2',3'-cyclic 3'-phosphodiesterase
LKHRLFLSIDLPVDQRSSVADIQARLNRFNLPVIWEPLEKIHLTLNFMGKIPGETIPDILSRVGRICSHYTPFSLQPYFLETLYSRHDPTIIYLAPSGDVEILKNFQKEISAELDDLLLPQSRKFLPHFTIGRLKRTDPVATKKFIDQLSDFEITPLPQFQVDKVVLYESFVTKSGSTFQKIDQVMIQ